MEKYVLGIIIIAVAVALFIICRELVCWYWKLNDIVRLLKKIAGEEEKVKP